MKAKGSASAGRKASVANLRWKTTVEGSGASTVSTISYPLSRAQHPLRGMDNHVPTPGDIGGGQRRAVVEFDAVADLESVGLAALRGLGHRGAQIAHKVSRRGRVFRI